MEEKAFFIEETRTFSNGDYADRVILQYRMSKDLIQIDRSVYTTFNLLGDVGGLYGLLVSIASALLRLINFGEAENNIASGLYSVEGSHPDPSGYSSSKSCLRLCLPAYC